MLCDRCGSLVKYTYYHEAMETVTVSVPVPDYTGSLTEYVTMADNVDCGTNTVMVFYDD